MHMLFCAGTMVLAAGLAPAHDYPKKPVRIVTTATGGGSDFAARVLGHELTRSLGQQVIIVLMSINQRSRNDPQAQNAA